MSSTVTQEWSPTETAEVELKVAFESLSSSPSLAFAATPKGRPKRFILHSKGYFDLRAYILTGKEFAKNREEFNTQIPEKSFQKLTTIDGEIHKKTRNTITSIGTSCQRYYDEHMSQIVQLADSAINWVEIVTGMLQHHEEINLLAQFNILLDEKYTKVSDFDDAFYAAREGAGMTLELLIQESTDRSAETVEALTAMRQFQELTATQALDVAYLKRQYKTGPVVNDSDVKTPYLLYLNQELTKAINKFNELITKQGGNASVVEGALSDRFLNMSFGPLGSATTVADSWRDVQVSEGWPAAAKLIFALIKLQIDRKDENTLILTVEKLLRTFEDIQGKMKSAIAALTDLHQLFTDQSKSYQKIRNYLRALDKAIDFNVKQSRKLFINTNLKLTVAQLNQLAEVAREFKADLVSEMDVNAVLK